MRIVGLTGKKGSGKDTASLALIEEGWARSAFANPLREMLFTLNPIVWVDEGGSISWRDALEVGGYDEMKTWPEVRRLMQVFGTEVMREWFGQNVWVDIAMRKLTGFDLPDVVFTDVCFDNEAEAIIARNGIIIETVRPDLDSDDAHASEAGISRQYINATVFNSGSVEDLHAQIRRAVHG